MEKQYTENQRALLNGIFYVSGLIVGLVLGEALLILRLIGAI